jgi:hypothetical protein
VAVRELWYAVAVGLAGLAVATLALLTPWYPGPERPTGSAVQLVAPGGVAGQR